MSPDRPAAAETALHAREWSRIAREVVGTTYPWAPAHVVLGPEDTSVVPHELHPSFYGALDWHSSVHMQWSLVILLTRYADALGEQEAGLARALLGERLTPAAVAVEVDYLRARPGFERPYGWAWATQLAAAVADLPADLREEAVGWRDALAPLTDLLVERVVSWLPRQGYPIRHGKHQNDAFALLLLLDAAERLGRDELATACRDRALDWFGGDRDRSTEEEPGGADFLSPALTEALLLTRVLPEAAVADRLADLLPGLGAGAHEHLLAVPTVLDPTDGQGAHLLGLALSRAWALRGLAPHLGPEPAARCRAAADQQETAVLRQIVDGDFMATHWLVSFALLAAGALDRGRA